MKTWIYSIPATAVWLWLAHRYVSTLLHGGYPRMIEQSASDDGLLLLAFSMWMVWSFLDLSDRALPPPGRGQR